MKQLLACVSIAECAIEVIAPVVAAGAIMELITIAIAVVSCLYFKIKLNRYYMCSSSKRSQ